MHLVLPSDKANSGNIGKLIVERSLVSDLQDIVNSLNDYFMSVASNVNLLFTLLDYQTHLL